MENPIKMDDLGVPLFLETPTWRLPLTKNPQLYIYISHKFGAPIICHRSSGAWSVLRTLAMGLIPFANGWSKEKECDLVGSGGMRKLVLLSGPVVHMGGKESWCSNMFCVFFFLKICMSNGESRYFEIWGKVFGTILGGFEKNGNTLQKLISVIFRGVADGTPLKILAWRLL